MTSEKILYLWTTRPKDYQWGNTELDSDGPYGNNILRYQLYVDYDW